MAVVCACACTPPEGGDAVVFEGARVVVGDGGSPIDEATLVVEDGVFTAVGRTGDVRTPTGASRVDLHGATVVPALIDAHVHVGYTDFAAATDGAENYSEATVRDHMRRMAYLGIGTAASLGLDAGDEAFRVRAAPGPDEARLLTAGMGIALPDAGPSWVDRRDRAHGVTTEEEARAVVRDLAEREVDLVKIWVDDRGGRVPKLPPDLYRAVIDEAHARGLRVVAHVYYLEDAKELLRAGVDGFAHGVRDLDADDELLSLLRARPDFFLIPNLPYRGERTVEDLAFLDELHPAGEASRRRAALAERIPAPSPSFELQARNLRRFRDAGVRIVLGTDWPGAGGNAHEEMADLVAAGLTPAEVLTAATGAASEALGLEDRGTIQVGKRADFVVLDRNPLDDIRNTRSIASVYLGGVLVDRVGLRQSWRDR